MWVPLSLTEKAASRRCPVLLCIVYITLPSSVHNRGSTTEVTAHWLPTHRAHSPSDNIDCGTKIFVRTAEFTPSIRTVSCFRHSLKLQFMTLLVKKSTISACHQLSIHFLHYETSPVSLWFKHCTLPSYFPRRCGEMWSLVTENALSLHCLHSCAWLLLAWRLFIQPQKRPS